MCRSTVSRVDTRKRTTCLVCAVKRKISRWTLLNAGTRKEVINGVWSHIRAYLGEHCRAAQSRTLPICSSNRSQRISEVCTACQIVPNRRFHGTSARSNPLCFLEAGIGVVDVTELGLKVGVWFVDQGLRFSALIARALATPMHISK